MNGFLHIILGILKAKKGIAYNILKELNVNEYLLEEKILQPIEKQKNEIWVLQNQVI